jgi:hypothetical protein
MSLPQQGDPITCVSPGVSVGEIPNQINCGGVEPPHLHLGTNVLGIIEINIRIVETPQWGVYLSLPQVTTSISTLRRLHVRPTCRTESIRTTYENSS